VSRLRRFTLGVYEFVLGDDWRTALGVAAAIGATALVSSAGASAWWVMPPAVFALLGVSLLRALNATGPR
jgi:hypothetical protein